MRLLKRQGMLTAGICAGAVNGIFGAGGGMVLIPLLSGLTDLEEQEKFPASIAVILPICLTSLSVSLWRSGVDFTSALPYLPGSALGGLLAGLLGKRIPLKWLHRGLGAMILWGGVRYLC